MKIYNKLVRDKIPEIIRNSGSDFTIHTASDSEYSKLLEAKLIEETNEYINDKNIEELSDILEVTIALAKNLGYSENDLFDKRNEKRNTRGGFEKKIVLEKVMEKYLQR